MGDFRGGGEKGEFRRGERGGREGKDYGRWGGEKNWGIVVCGDESLESLILRSFV